MANSGAYPVNTATDVGWLRTSLGDTNATNIGSSTADYTYFSDDALQTIIDLYDDRQMQVAIGYQRIAQQLTESAKLIKVDDIAIDTRTQAESYLALAAQALSLANSQGLGDLFLISQTGKLPDPTPEGAIDPNLDFDQFYAGV